MKLLKSLAVAGLLTTAVTPAAHAVELTCSAPTIYTGKQSKDAHDTVVGVDVYYSDGEWQVRHRMGNGSEVHRESQYSIRDTSTQNYTQWRGYNQKYPNLQMVGEIKQDKRSSQLFYVEWIYDGNGKLKMSSAAPCKEQTATLQPVPAPAARSEPPTTMDGMPNWLR